MKMSLFLQVILFSNIFVALANGATQETKDYIVYMGGTGNHHHSVLQEHHHNLLTTVIGDAETAREAKIHSYGRSFNGFAARLQPHEAERLRNEDGVVSVFENTYQKPHTSRSWDYLGLPQTLKPGYSSKQSNVIVGVIDSGIYIDSPSFNDEGYGPIPAKWKGVCVTGKNFPGCNRKVIGARIYTHGMTLTNEEVESPIDTEGHGTHTASIIAGVPVSNASLYGIAEGTARGGVSSARIAVYKVCWDDECSVINVLAAFDDAIADGVDVISVSLSSTNLPYFEEAAAIGAFHAMRKGVVTSCSAGNDGPAESSVQNLAPWIMTVAATSIDRKFVTQVKLGDGQIVSGLSLNTFAPKRKMYPLISGTLATNNTKRDYTNPRTCDHGSLGEIVKGKIVYCVESMRQDDDIRDLGGAGIIMGDDEISTEALFPLMLSGTNVLQKDGDKIERYINTTKNPTAVIERTSWIKQIAPSVAAFSSRGPQHLSPNILKPDISAPGINILAAYSPVPNLLNSDDPRHAMYNIISGTSMACPHATAAAAYVKSLHPDWSAAAIKSAILTTATPMKVRQDDGELGSGAGQINPLQAAHPGLVYDINISSYLRFLCKEGYDAKTLNMVVRGGNKYFRCTDFKPAKGLDGLNYPTMFTQLRGYQLEVSSVFYRTVKNVGFGKSVYTAKITSPKDISIEVIPNRLVFGKTHDQRSFKVVVKGEIKALGTQVLSGLLEWSDGKHSVRSPIVVYRA